MQGGSLQHNNTGGDEHQVRVVVMSYTLFHTIISIRSTSTKHTDNTKHLLDLENKGV